MMSVELIPFLAVCIFIVAMMYASVGHGGASGYLAVMALFSLHPEALKPTALLLNIVVPVSVPTSTAVPGSSPGGSSGPS